MQSRIHPPHLNGILGSRATLIGTTLTAGPSFPKNCDEGVLPIETNLPVGMVSVFRQVGLDLPICGDLSVKRFARSAGFVLRVLGRVARSVGFVLRVWDPASHESLGSFVEFRAMSARFVGFVRRILGLPRHLGFVRRISKSSSTDWWDHPAKMFCFVESSWL